MGLFVVFIPFISEISCIATQKQWAKKQAMDFPFFSLKTVFMIYLWALVVARWLLIRDVHSHMGLCCCLWCPTKSASASVVTPTCTERALRGIPPCQGETSHSNKDSFVLNNTFTVGLHNGTRMCCFTYNLCAGGGRGGVIKRDLIRLLEQNNNNEKNQNVNKKRRRLWNSYNTTQCYGTITLM